MLKLIISGNDTTEEKIYNTTSKDHAIELFKRDYCFGNYRIINIIDLIEIENNNRNEVNKNERQEKTIKEIEKKIKLILKNPFNTNGSRRFLEIPYNKTYMQPIENSLQNQYAKIIIDEFNYYFTDSNIEIHLKDNSIQVNSTDKYIKEF